MIPRYYTITPFAGQDAGCVLFTVDWSAVNDGRFPIRAFGPASFAACQQFLDLVERQGLSHAEARDVTLTDEAEVVA